MIDRAARSKLAEAARALVAGRISNDAFEGRVPASRDRAIAEIYSQCFWRLYSDTHRYPLRGPHRPTGEARALASRCILFLKSDRPYKWPASAPLYRVITLRLHRLRNGRWRLPPRRTTGGDHTVWPFHSLGEYQQALRSPPYLSGSRLRNVHADHWHQG